MRPVINLVPEVLWGGGTGTASDPYIPTLGNSQTENKVNPTPYYNTPVAGTYIRPFTVEFKTQIKF